MATTPPPLTPFSGAAPQRGDKTTFSPRVDAFVTWLIAVVTQFIAIAANVYANAQEAFISAGTATSAAATAAATANATLWVSGATVQQYAAVISPTDGATYRRIGATSSGTTDPKLDVVNYVALSSLPFAYLKVSDHRSPGSACGASISGTQTRTLNTVDFSGIPGASLASNTITLPAGTYEVFIRVPGYGVGAHITYLYNSADSTTTLLGSSAVAVGGNQTDSWITGDFSITTTKTFQVKHITTTAVATNGLGFPSTFNPEIYAEAIFKKVA